MTRLFGRTWVRSVIVLAVRAFTVSRFQGVLGPHWSVPAFGAADLIVQFKPDGLICEVYGPVGRVAAGALRLLVTANKGAGDRRVTDRLAKGV